MFRVIADPQAPLTPENVLTLENFVDAYNPLKYPLTFQKFNLLQWVNVLKVLWCRENIIENFDHYFLEGGLRGLEDRADIIKYIPDDKLYLLHFVRLTYRGNSRNQLEYQVSSPVRAYSDGSYGVLEYSYEPVTRSSYSYRTENWGSEITSVLQRVEADLNRHMLPHSTRYHANFSSPQVYNNHWIVYFVAQMMAGFSVFDLSHTLLSRSQVAQTLQNDPTAELVNEAIPGSEPVIRLKCPISKLNKTPLHKCFSYSTSPLTMLTWPIVAKGEHKPVLYGIELEMSTDYTVKQLIDASDEPFFIMKQDSSVSGSKKSAFEMVTVPMSYKAHKKQWAYWFSNLDYNKFDCTKDTTNGMHIHIGVESFASEKHKQDFTWFFTQPAHQDFMFTFSERTAQSMHHYAPMPSHSSRSTIVQAYKNTLKLVKNKRGAINYSPKGTIEVRLYRGIVSLADVLKNLEFTDSIFHFTMDEKNVGQLTLPAYFHWLSQRPKNQYKILKKYFDANDRLKPLIKAAPVLAAIFTETNPDKIIEIMKRRRFEATMDHVTILNKKFKKRIFIYNKETKTIELNQSNKSPVSFLDRLVEARILGVSRLGSQPIPAPQTAEPTEDYTFDDEGLFEEVAEERYTPLTAQPAAPAPRHRSIFARPLDDNF